MIAIKYASNSTLTGATTTTGVAVDSTTDFTGAIDLSGLTPDTQYWYTRVIDGVEQDVAPYPSFKTFPAAGNATSFSFAFGSCTKHSDTIGEDLIFNAVPAGTRFLLHMGDTVYADRDSPIATTLPDYRTQHRTALTGSDITAQDYKALRERMPVFTTWDDHDIANDFSSGTGAAIYAPAKQAFQEYGARANPDSLTTGELYYTFQYGDVGFFVLDGRSFRSSNSATDNSSKTILGATQKTALKNWLLTNKTALTLKFICSSTPAHGYGANTGGDSWGGVDDGTQAPNGANGFRTERNEIFDYIDANQIPGVVIISGDQHWAGSFKTTYANRPRYEFMSTPLNMTNTASFMLTAVARAADSVNGPVFWKLDNTLNFGLVTVDTTTTPATVSFQLYGTSGSLGASYLTSLTADDINASLIPVPSVALSASFPAAPHVGDTVSFDVTATLVGGATGTLTVTVDQLPAGLALGTTSQVDSTHYKATVSGTLTTVQDITATFDATGGSVSATPLAHEFNVQAQASVLTVIDTRTSQPTSSSTGSHPAVTFTNVKAGDTIIVLSYLSAATGLVATISDDASNSYSSDLACASDLPGVASVAHAVAKANAASLTVSLAKNKGSFGNMVAYLLRGAPLTFDATHSFANRSGALSPSSVTFGPYSTTGRAFIAWIEGNHQTGGDAVTASGSSLTYTVDLAADNSDYVLAESVITGAAVSSDSFTVANTNTATAHAYYALGIFNY